MRTWIVVTALAGIPLQGCFGIGGRACTAVFIYGVNASVTDAETGAAVSGATLTLTEGDYSEIMEEVSSGSGQYVGAGERAGTYALTIAADGYASQMIENIVVEGDECHVTGVTRELALTPI